MTTAQAPSERDSMDFFSPEWVQRVADQVNSGPSAERRQGLDAEYWQFFDFAAQGITARLGLVVRSVTSEPDRYAYLDIECGKITGAGVAPSEERAKADFVIGGRASDWKDVWSGRRSIGQNMMYRRINLYQGNLHTFMRSVSFFVELLMSARRVPTTFGQDADVKGAIGVWEGVTV